MKPDLDTQTSKPYNAVAVMSLLIKAFDLELATLC